MAIKIKSPTFPESVSDKASKLVQQRRSDRKVKPVVPESERRLISVIGDVDDVDDVADEQNENAEEKEEIEDTHKMSKDAGSSHNVTGDGIKSTQESFAASADASGQTGLF